MSSEAARAAAELEQENAQLRHELAQARQELTEAIEQQAATSEVLKVISRSTFDLEPVLEDLIEHATRLCSADHGVTFKFDGELFRPVAASRVSPVFREYFEQNPLPSGRGSITGRVGLERRTIHVADIRADPDYELHEHVRLGAFRTVLGVPMLREGVPIGVIFVWRTEVRPFTAKQIELLETFADQAVIAVENTRLFTELQDRNRDLAEALEQQTATSEILRVISSSPKDLQQALGVIVRRAARLPGVGNAGIHRVEGESLREVANYWTDARGVPLAGDVRPLDRLTVTGRAVIDGRTVHVPDLAEAIETEFPASRRYFRFTATEVRSRYRSSATDVRSGRLLLGGTKLAPTPRRRSRSSRRLPIRRSSRSRTLGCSPSWRPGPGSWPARWRSSRRSATSVRPSARPSTSSKS